MMYHFPIGYDNHHPSQIERRDFLFLGQGEPTKQDRQPADLSFGGIGVRGF